jgi:hypothetical protein
MTQPNNSPPQAPTRALYPIKEARFLLGSISTATIYRLAAKGEIKITKFGDRSFISSAEIARLSS